MKSFVPRHWEFGMPASCAPATAPAERRDQVSRRALIDRVRAEFIEMPGARLTCAQAQRLFAMRVDICERVFATLEQQGFLVRGIDGRYGSRRGSVLLARARLFGSADEKPAAR
jgi:hypothetical protein